jgi:predicted transcriptional regulator YdeE
MSQLPAYPMHVIGMSIVTTNALAMSAGTIGQLWHAFKNIPVKDKIGSVLSSDIFAVYSDYENGDKASYRLTVGYAVDRHTHVPEGCVKVTVPDGVYQTYPSNSSAVQDVVATWKTIWDINPEVRQRRFLADFERYQESGEMCIYIGYVA